MMDVQGILEGAAVGLAVRRAETLAREQPVTGGERPSRGDGDRGRVRAHPGPGTLREARFRRRNGRISPKPPKGNAARRPATDPPAAARDWAAWSRGGRIDAALDDWTGPRTADGRPTVRALRKVTGHKDITPTERDRLWRKMRSAHIRQALSRWRLDNGDRRAPAVEWVRRSAGHDDITTAERDWYWAAPSRGLVQGQPWKPAARVSDLTLATARWSESRDGPPDVEWLREWTGWANVSPAERDWHWGKLEGVARCERRPSMRALGELAGHTKITIRDACRHWDGPVTRSGRPTVRALRSWTGRERLSAAERDRAWKRWRPAARRRAIAGALRGWDGPVTRSGRPQLHALRRAAGIPDISPAERDTLRNRR